MTTETPAYTIEFKEGKFEIRLYTGYILAQVDVEADFDKALGQGFSILAGYIFGGNKKRLGISMTTPVKEEEIQTNLHRISFTMPSQYELNTLPEPDDKRIKFKELKNERMAVLQFSGRVKSGLARKKINELQNWVSQKGFKPKSNFIVAQYNHPAVPGFLRKNEIMVKI